MILLLIDQENTTHRRDQRMKTYAVFYTVNGEHYTNTVTCFQPGEAHNWTVEDASKKHNCSIYDVHIDAVIEMI